MPQATSGRSPSADAVVCINMVHISPWRSTEGLMRGAGRVLPSGAPLILYGPYRRAGHALEPSNAAFDESLKARDPSWGLRELEAVEKCAAANGLDPVAGRGNARQQPDLGFQEAMKSRPKSRPRSGSIPRVRKIAHFVK